MKIYVFGNTLITGDSVAPDLIPALSLLFPIVQFIEQDPNEQFPPEGEKNPIILDCVQGIQKAVKITIDDLSPIEKTPISPHDYDLLFHLHLLRKMKRIQSAIIIGTPRFARRTEVLRDVELIIATLLSESGKHTTCTDQTNE